MFVVVALAAMRLTRLAIMDSISEPIRIRIIAKTGLGGKIHKLLSCSWCAGFWICLILGTITWFYRGVWVMLPLVILALSQTVGLASKLDR